MVREPSDAFYGERGGTIRDPFGHEWNIGHEIEKVDARGDAASLYGAAMNQGS